MEPDRPAAARRLHGSALILGTLCTIIAISAVVLSAQGLVTYGEIEKPPPDQPTITTSVGQGRISEQVTGDVTVEPEFERQLLHRQASDREPIVTRAGLRTGDSARSGEVIATIAERPVIVFQGNMPSYRSMGPESSGPDVTQLQEALTNLGYSIWDTRGYYGPSTATAVYNLYISRGYEPLKRDGTEVNPAQPHLTAVPFGEIRFLPSLPVTALDTCGDPAEIVSDTICTLTGGNPQITVSIPEIHASEVRTGQPVQIELRDGSEIKGTLGAQNQSPDLSKNPAPSKPSATSKVSESDVNIESFGIKMTSATKVKNQDAGTATITVAQSEPKALTVEGIAIRTGPNGKTWLLTPTAGRIDVKVGLCASGYCAVQGQGQGQGLRPGVEVALPSPTEIKNNASS